MEPRRDSMIARKPVPSATTHHVGTGYQVVNPVETGTHINGQNLLSADVRTRSSMWWTLFWDCILVIPGVAFLVYAVLVAVHAGRAITESPVPALMDASGYGPTIFPIAFAAVAANVLKSYAAWKLERGISLLDLEYLLSSRTVFSAFTTPFSLRALNILAPALMALWAMSPLGGQAALRVMTVVPSAAFETHDFQWLEYMAQFPHGGSRSSAGADFLPAAAGGFAAALSSPMDVKTAPRDVFGNVKIPMVEVYASSDKVEADPDGWYIVGDLEEDEDGVRYASLAGLPLTSQDNLTQVANYSLTIDTAYLYSGCSVTHSTGTNLTEWREILNATRTKAPVHDNDSTLMLLRGNSHTVFSDTPLEMIFTSWTEDAITNATCNFTMSYVQAEISCHRASCEAVRLRPVTRPANVTVQTVLDGVGPQGDRQMGVPPESAFFDSFVKASLTYWQNEWATDQYSTPIEYYFTNPGSPYVASRAAGRTWRGADIYPIGSALFSRRFTQLLNTFWIVNIAPFEYTSGLQYGVINATQLVDPETGFSVRHIKSSALGTVTPDVLVMRPDTPWLVVLFVSSAIMFSAAVVAATLGFLREGPDVLDRATSFLAYNHHAGNLVRTDTEVSMKTAAWREQQIKLGFRPEAAKFEQGMGWTPNRGRYE